MSRKTQTAPRVLRVAVYTRVSSEEQVKEHYSLDTQREACLAKLDSVIGPNLYEPHFFTDEGLPGSYGLYDPTNPRRKYRPGLTQMRDAFRKGDLDAICVYRMSRLWRKAASGDFLLQEFCPHGLTRVISCTENVDIDTASGRFMLNVTAAMGAYEAEQLGEWVSDALQKRTREGYTIGDLYGWRRQTDAEMTGRRRGIMPVEEEARTIRGMAEEFLAGGTLRGIAEDLNTRGTPRPRRAREWSTSTVRSVLSNPVHAGLVRAKSTEGVPELIRGQHFDHRILEPEMHHQIIARLERNADQHTRTTGTPQHLLSGILRCGHCGYRMNGRTVRRLGERMYRCSTGSQRSNPDCIRNSERADMVEAVILDELRRLAGDERVRAQAADRIGKTLARQEAGLAEQVSQLEQRLRKVDEDYLYWSREFREGRCQENEFALHVAEHRRQREEASALLEQRRSELKQQDSRQAVLARAQGLVSDFARCWDGLDLHQRREFVHSVLEYATMAHLEDGSTEVRFRLRGFEECVRIIRRRSVRGRASSGLESLTPRQQAFLYHYGQGLDRNAIAKKTGVTRSTADLQLRNARKKLGAETLDEAWELACEYIEGNLHWLPPTGRKRKHKPPKEGPLLTDAQVALLSLLAQGMTVADAARALDMKGSTPYVHLKNSRDRLGCASNEEAVRKAKDLGLVW
ncbi:MAG: recombinase family protein [Armatimonadetes bacterium]|nr:recombinase family protein [Armatimonadota bacterium]